MTLTKDTGWIKVNRSEMDEWMWSEDSQFDKFHAWIDILLNVNYKKKEIPFGSSVITIEPGCLLTSVLKLSKRRGWNRRTVTRFLALLKDSNKIEYESFKNGLMIKVLQKMHRILHNRVLNLITQLIKNNKSIECYKGRTEEAPDLPKIKFLENVLLTKREYDTLVSEFGRSDTDSAIKFL